MNLAILIAAAVFLSKRASKPVAEINKAAGAESGANRSLDVFAEYAVKELGAQRNAASGAAGAWVYSEEETAFRPARTEEPLHVFDSEGKIMLNLYVESQNPRIGKRNVNQMKPGSSLSIGGGNSSFLVFLVKFPPKLAELRYDNGRCSLAILKPEFFPYEKSNLIEDCIERPVTIVSEKGYPVTFMIRQFEDPVVSLNRLLNSINVG